MSWLVSAKQYIPAVIGEPWGGGYFAGYISHTADGNPTHALIVAPRATGATGTGYTLTTNLAWKTVDTITVGATSAFDGAANTAAMAAAGIASHPAAQFCVNLNIGGFTDWYLPSRYEMDIAYFNLKPYTQANSVTDGINTYAVPRRTTNWTADYPRQTYISESDAAFALGNHWTSLDNTASTAWSLNTNNGAQSGVGGKTGFNRVRAFRRIAL